MAGLLLPGALPWAGVAASAGLVVAAVAAVFFALRLRTARRAARARAADAADANWRLDLALRAAGLGYWEYDPESRALYFDARKRAMLGIDPDEPLTEENWLARVHPEDRDRVQAEVRRALASGETIRFECRVSVPGRGLRHIEDTAGVFVGQDGRRRMVGLVSDVTERRAVADELRERHSRAEAAAKEMARFLATMSHEIRTPMTGILGMIELLIQEPDAETRGERLDIARRSAGTLLTILNDVLSFSRLEAGKLELRPEPFQPRELAAEAVDLLAPKARDKGLRLRWDIAPEVPAWVIVDPDRARQILVNLLSNAIKFTDSGEVSLRLGMVPGAMALRFEVRDTGIGMSADFIPRAFESFTREEETGGPREGTGLGLAISRHLAQLMGGAIGIESRLGQGTVARFDLPVAKVSGAAPPDHGPAGAAGPAPMRILVAEDNSTNRYLVRALLEREGHHVTTVSDGAEAARLAAEGDFDVILMDVQMPVMDGAAATRTIRASGTPSAQVPIIALTANALANDRQTYLACGMSDYVAKPIALAELNGALARVSGQYRKAAE